MSKTVQAVLHAPTAAVAALADAGVSGMALGGYKLALAALLLVSSAAGRSWFAEDDQGAGAASASQRRTPRRSAEPKAATAPPCARMATAIRCPMGPSRAWELCAGGMGIRSAGWRTRPMGKRSLRREASVRDPRLWDAASGKLLHRFAQTGQPYYGVGLLAG